MSSGQESVNEIFKRYRLLAFNIFTFVVNNRAAEDLAQNGARSSADTVMNNFGPIHIQDCYHNSKMTVLEISHS